MVLVDNNKNSFLIGLSPDATKDMGSVGIKITKGKIFTNTIDNKEVTVGKMFLEDENKSLGDNVNIKGEKYKIVGVFESGDPTIDAGISMPIKSVQRVLEDKNHVSIIYVYLEKDSSVVDVSKIIEDKYGKNLSAISSITDIETMADALAMVNAASMGISLLAVLIGEISIINTMIMSVYERIREIGVLRAVGWKKRVLGMIIGESMVLTLSSAIIGSILGVIGVELMIASGILGSIGVFYPVYTINIFVQVFSIAIIVGITGGLYPAWRASRFSPTEALRYE